MVRIRQIDLANVKNVRHGSISFKDTSFGSCVTGIYGQNGSGKTAVVDALACLKTLMCGNALPSSCIDLIGPASKRARVEVEFEITEGTAQSFNLPDTLGMCVAEGKSYIAGYSFEFDEASNSPRVLAESLYVRAEGVMKRVLFSYDLGATGKDYVIRPSVHWKALRHLAGSEADLDLSVAQRSDDLRASSKVFSRALDDFAISARHAYDKASEAGNLSQGACKAYKATLSPLLDSIVLLQYFAFVKLEVFDTTRGAGLAFNAFSLSSPLGGNGSWARADGVAPEEKCLRDLTIPVDSTTVIPVEVYKDLSSAVEVENRVLETIVPGLNIEINALNNETMDDGALGTRVEVLSCRRGVRVPFRSESEGIKKIVSMLGRIIDIYGDESACLVIDEVDSGVFEFLLGELLQTIVEHAKGQLIFTAHNLRPLECLPSGCLMFTTVNPDNRYIKFRGSAATNNLRSQYLRAINLGGQQESVYEQTNELDMDAAFFRACHPREKNFDELLAELVS